MEIYYKKIKLYKYENIEIYRFYEKKTFEMIL